jgi:putative endonuclease
VGSIARGGWDEKASAGTRRARRVARAGSRNFCERRRAKMFLTESLAGSTSSLSHSRMSYFVYILECADKSLYTGVTNDLERRFDQHKNGKGGHYTSSKQVVKIVYTQQHPDKSSALKREAQIKSWPRRKKLALLK